MFKYSTFSLPTLTSPFGISQIFQNMDESSFKHFIEHMVGMGEIPKFQAQEVRLKLK